MTDDQSYLKNAEDIPFSSESEIVSEKYDCGSENEQYEEPSSQADSQGTSSVNENYIDQDEDGNEPKQFQWDFDEMLRRKSAERRKARKKHSKCFNLINDYDDHVMAMISAMRVAINEDIKANEQRKPAFHKRKLLSDVKKMLLKVEMYEALIDNGIMSAIADWLSPLPDKSLPSLEIRTELLKILQNFSNIGQGILRVSGLGRAVMFLFKHPKETKENKERAASLIRVWARPIFQLDVDFRSISKEERELRDLEHIPAAKRRRMSDPSPKPSDNEEQSEEEQEPFVPRARVPKPSRKDYALRPKYVVDVKFKGECRSKADDRLHKIRKDFVERTKTVKVKRSVPVSLYGTM